MLLELAGWITATTLVTMLVHIYALIGLWLLLGHLLGRSVRHRRIGHVELALATAGLVVVHLLEMLLWAFLIMHQTDLSRFGDALYYSMMSYTTVGYGDVVPHGDGRLGAGRFYLAGMAKGSAATGAGDHRQPWVAGRQGVSPWPHGRASQA